jgi:hypothetical protein
VDGSGYTYITGSTYSPNFPVAGAFQSTLGGGQDAFAAKIGLAGNALVYSAYLGGSGGAAGIPETGNGIAVDSTGCAYIAGATNSGIRECLARRAVAAAGLNVEFAGRVGPGNGAIVPAGTGGAVNAYATNDTELVVDINGYFVPPATGTLQFYPLTPCRVLDTRNPNGTFGGPSLAGGTAR